MGVRNAGMLVPCVAGLLVAGWLLVVVGYLGVVGLLVVVGLLWGVWLLGVGGFLVIRGLPGVVEGLHPKPVEYLQVGDRDEVVEVLNVPVELML